MAFLKKILSKLNRSFFYVVDRETLREYLNRSMKFALDNKLEFAGELNLYAYGEKHRINMFNNTASLDEEMSRQGVTVTYDDYEFSSVDELMRLKLNYLPAFVKIELTLADDVWLNEYKAAHPELRVEDY